MLNGSNCDRKSQFSGILTEPLNPRAMLTQELLSILALEGASRPSKLIVNICSSLCVHRKTKFNEDRILMETNIYNTSLNI